MNESYPNETGSQTNPATPNQAVFLASIDWDAAWQRHQALASEFALRGTQVFFVENTGFRDLRFSDARRVLRRLSGIILPTSKRRHIHPVPENIRVMAPLVLPPTHDLFRLINRRVLLPLVLRKLRRMGLRPGSLCIAYTPTRTNLDLLRMLAVSKLVYDVVDNLPGHPNRPADYAQTEQELIDDSAVLFTTAQLLQDLHAPRHPHVHCIHHGVPSSFFLPPPQPPKKHRRFCYFGTLRKGLDYDAINALARAGCEVSLIGPEQDAPPRLEPGVRREGLLPTRALLERLRGFDALLLPYTDCEFNRGIRPAKIYESLATGLPIISSELPALGNLKHLLYIAKSPADFAAAAARLDAEETPQRVADRIQEARKHSSSTQFEQILGFINESPARPQAAQASLSATAESFLTGLSWIAAFFVLAKFGTWALQLVAARWLGPMEYGTANLILAVNSALQLIPLMGFPLVLSRQTESTDAQTRTVFISTLMSVFIFWLGVSAALLFGMGSSLSNWTSLSTKDYHLALVLAYATASHLTVCAALQGLTRFRERGIMEAVYSLASTVLLAGLLASGHHAHATLILSLAGGLSMSTAFGAWTLREYLRPALHWGLLRKALPFAFIGSLNVLAAAFIQAPGRMCLFHFRSPEEAGVFSAYFTATIQVSLALSVMLWAVIVPLTSRPDGQKDAWSYLRRSLRDFSWMGTLFFIACGSAALLLAGRSYPLHFSWMLLFGTAAAAVFAHGVFSALYAARDLNGLMVSVAGACIAGAGNLLLNLLLVPHWGVPGSALSLLGGYGLALAWYFLRRPAAACHQSPYVRHPNESRGPGFK
ncbi:MAG: oligosaccharide flippase family protein [Elusimicrobiota bacterium]|jgi:O-antigen/teichoic acid export membrane protein/glycosyltransferase involved in cell wall biosynthesis